jgi:site-specific DNA-methyltransferase (adenine-specific)
MKPYYQDDFTTIYHADFRDALPLLAGVQLLATSPPYNVGIDYGDYKDDLPWPKWRKMMRDLADGAMAALRSGGIFAMNLAFVANQGRIVKRSRRERKTISRGEPIFSWAQLMIMRKGFMLREPLIWVKSPDENNAYAIGTGIGSDNNPYLRMAAEGFVLASKDHYHMPGGTGKRGARYSRPMELCKNVWHIRPGWEDPRNGTNHPTPWSRELCRNLITVFSNQGDVICDPFMGSGKLLLQAKLMGRKAIGIEINEKYCEAAANLCRQSAFEYEVIKESLEWQKKQPCMPGFRQ